MSSTAAHDYYHAVQFYDSDQSLCSTVAGFLAEGLFADEPALVFATEEHRAAILEELGKRLTDVHEARRNGSLVLLDAHDMLSTFMAEDVPNAGAFERTIGGFVADTVSRHPGKRVRAYGEMVNLLWRDGRQPAAIQVEMLWNRLAETHRFALLCGYSMGQFYKRTPQYEEVCRHHTRILEPGADVAVLEPQASPRTALAH